MLITVDCGTTNMRCRLFHGTVPKDEICRRAGVRNTAFDGTSAFLESSLKSSVAELLERNSLAERDVEAILSSGTLASDVGIFTIPHAVAPVGITESAAAARMVTLPEISSIPILFIPGVKTLPAAGETDKEKFIAALESMSGEECETYGIMEQLGLKGDFSITLPGSYNKAMEINGAGQITSIRTGMCGEFIAAMSEHTLLRHSLPSPVIRRILPERLVQGFEFAVQHGVSPSLIKARTAKLFGGWDADEAANFFVGALLKDDVISAGEIAMPGKPFVVGGSNPLRHIFTLLLAFTGVDNIIEISDSIAKAAPSIGAMKVYKMFQHRQ